MVRVCEGVMDVEGVAEEWEEEEEEEEKAWGHNCVCSLGECQ